MILLVCVTHEKFELEWWIRNFLIVKLQANKHDTIEAWGQKACKERPQVDLVKTGFLF